MNSNKWKHMIMLIYKYINYLLHNSADSKADSQLFGK